MFEALKQTYQTLANLIAQYIVYFKDKEQRPIRLQKVLDCSLILKKLFKQRGWGNTKPLIQLDELLENTLNLNSDEIDKTIHKQVGSLLQNIENEISGE